MERLSQQLRPWIDIILSWTVAAGLGLAIVSVVLGQAQR